MSDLLDFTHNSKVILFCSLWLLVLGFIVLGSYFLKDKNVFFKSIADFLISFSFVKRTKSILISYSFLLLFLGLIGVVFSLVQ